MKEKMKKSFLLLLIMALVCIPLTACGGGGGSEEGAGDAEAEAAAGSEDQIVWSFASCFAEGSSYNTMIEQPMKEKLEEMTGGRITIQFYPSGTVASWGTAMQAVMDGACDMAYDVPVIYKGVYPYTEAFAAPGFICYGSAAETRLFNDYIEKFCPDEFDDFYVVSFYGGGNHGIFSTDPINTLDDMKGKTYGMDSEIADILDVEGLAPVSTTATEVYEQLKMGTVSGAVQAFYAGFDYHYYEVCSNYTYFPFAGSDGIIVLNKDKYEALPDDLKPIVDEWSAWVTENLTSTYGDKLNAEAEKYITENYPDFTITALDESYYDQIIENGKEYEKKAFEGYGIDYAAWEWLVENGPKYSDEIPQR